MWNCCLLGQKLTVKAKFLLILSLFAVSCLTPWPTKTLISRKPFVECTAKMETSSSLHVKVTARRPWHKRQQITAKLYVLCVLTEQ